MCASPFVDQSRGFRFCGNQPVFRTGVYAMSLNMRAQRVWVLAVLRRARPPASHSPVKSMQLRGLHVPTEDQRIGDARRPGRREACRAKGRHLRDRACVSSLPAQISKWVPLAVWKP